AMIRYGETCVLCNVTMSDKPRDGVDFFPLSVEFEEKLYAAGRIPGSCMRREGRPGEHAILSSRVVDRPIRPLFPKDMRNDVCVTMTVMSLDPDCSAEISGMNGASLAIAMSDIPWGGPIAGVFVGLVDGEIVLNPTKEQREHSDLSLTLAASEEKIVMIEAGANEVDEETMMKAIRAGHEEIKKMLAFINGIVAEIGKPKKSFTPVELDHDLLADVYAKHLDEVKAAMDTDDKNVRDAALLPIMDAIAAEHPDLTAADLDLISYKLQKKVVRTWLLEDGKRVDGRGINEIRPLAAEVGLLPRVHGSGMFTRGQTQVLTICTLGSTKDAQLMDDLSDTPYKRYIHHYNFPPYSVGEARAPRSPGRREIGHGNLAERALIPVLPDQAEFPYTIRCVSEVLSSNGSTSQASICGSTLALMDAGVPIKAPVAGISCGLITDGDPLHGGRWMTMLDIQGVEDFHGDMDFKVGGTRRGITAIQMDIKVDGLTYEIVEEALEKCRKGRLYILDQIIKPVIAEPRAELSKYAPKMFSMMIPVDKIKDVIGKGGKVIQEMCANFNCKIDIEEDGHVFISAVDQDDAKRAIATIKTIVEDPEIGAIYKGRVTRLMNFGAFVEIAPGKEGLVHISKLDDHRVEHVEDVVAVGDPIFVMVTDIDQQGRINLSRKDALAAIAKKRAEAAQQ
ncbi:polyribonucleotide nucleotidyltransferase, partial [Gemmiger sp.]|uniref:polyribonucleotide nucleotidyltransferase n=1 Tax=Gemmiger sp. TaxID=2049027 RepID=UPI003A937583